MVFRRISKDMKMRALQMLQLGWQLPEIVDALGVSEKSIDQWVANYEQHGDVQPRSVLQGRPRLIRPAILEELQELILQTPSLFLDEISEWLAIYHDQPITTSALNHNLQELGLTYKLLQKAAAERDDIARAQWKYDIVSNFTADQMVFADELSKDGRTLICKYGRAPMGERAAESLSLDRGLCYSILPALTLGGYIAIRVVQGSIDGAEFYDWVVNDLLPKMNRYPGPCSVLIIDNCATHKSDAVREAVEAAGCLLIFLPPYSPDFNPIEESFSCLKYYLCRHWKNFQESDVPEIDLLEACVTAVDAEKAKGWFHHSGYVRADELHN